MPTLSHIQQQLWDSFRLRPVVAAELEWYARPVGTDGPASPDPAVVIDTARDAAALCGLTLESLEPERGPGQWELSLPPTPHPAALAEALLQLRAALETTFAAQGLIADFRAKPYPDQYGSALHIHLHLEDDSGRSVFWKDGDELSPPLAHSLAGLLATMEASLPVFAPTQESHARFVPGWHAPVNASWGGNNRTVALRLPDGTGSFSGAERLARLSPSRSRRIEHRVAGADADPATVMAAILQGVHHGLSHRLTPPEPIHGDAAHSQYGLPRWFA